MTEERASYIDEIDLEERVGETWENHGHGTAVSVLRPVLYIEKAFKEHGGTYYHDYYHSDQPNGIKLGDKDSSDKHTSKKDPSDEGAPENDPPDHCTPGKNPVMSDVSKSDSGKQDNSEQHAGKSKGMFYRVIASFILEVEILDFDHYHNKFNRFFDTISLRYLYNEFEHHEFTPGPDGYATFNAQDETKKTQEATAGISGSANGVTPSLELHVTSERTLTVARDYKSWRRGVSMEKYPPPPAERRMKWKRFEVRSKAPRISSEYCCPDWNPPRPEYYNRSVHWEWQAELAFSPSWAPEIYESITFPITITRILDGTTVDNLRKNGLCYELMSCLHFDFIVERRLRVIGNCCTNSLKPPEKRVRGDFGQPMPPEHLSFCMYCHPGEVKWPKYETHHLKAAAEMVYKEAMKHGGKPSKMPSDEILEQMRAQNRQQSLFELAKTENIAINEAEKSQPGFGEKPGAQLANEGNLHVFDAKTERARVDEVRAERDALRQQLEMEKEKCRNFERALRERDITKLRINAMQLGKLAADSDGVDCGNMKARLLRIHNDMLEEIQDMETQEELRRKLEYEIRQRERHEKEADEIRQRERHEKEADEIRQRERHEKEAETHRLKEEQELPKAPIIQGSKWKMPRVRQFVPSQSEPLPEETTTCHVQAVITPFPPLIDRHPRRPSMFLRRQEYYRRFFLT